jgi:UDP-N-acetyl-D-mannosaminuronic acid dehydrogenase
VASANAPAGGFDVDVCVVGGCGRAGVPLGIALASRGLSVVLYDPDADAVDVVNSSTLPFVEEGAAEVLADVIAAGRLRATTDPASAGSAENLVLVVGAPVDEQLNPDLDALERCAEHLREGHLVVLRSTVYPGVTALTEKLLASKRIAVDVAFCPDRIAEGKAMTELFELPQIVAARTPVALARAEALFRRLTTRIVQLEPEEAERC